MDAVSHVELFPVLAFAESPVASIEGGEKNNANIVLVANTIKRKKS